MEPHTQSHALTPFTHTPSAPQNFLWRPYLPLGKITLLLGPNDAGKSLLALHIAARITSATPLPNAADSLTEAATLLISKDHPQSFLRPRLDAAHAHIPHIHHIPSLTSLFTPAPTKKCPSPLNPIDILHSALADNPAIKLLIIDSLPDYVPPSSTASIAGAIASLAEIAALHQVAILATARIPHTRLPRIPAPLAACAHTILLLVHDPRDPLGNRRLLLPFAHTLTAPPPALSFRITEGPTLTFDPRPLPPAHNPLSPPDHRHESLLETATNWLADALAGGPVAAYEIKEAARDNVIAPRTLLRAKVRLGILSQKDSYSHWWWKLPNDTTPVPPEDNDAPSTHESSLLEKLATFALNGNL